MTVTPKQRAHRLRERPLVAAAAALLLCAALGIALLALRRQPPAPPVVPIATVRPLFEAQGGDILSIAVYPSAHPPYRLVRKDSGFSVQDQPDYPLKAQDVEHMVAWVCSVLPAGTVGELSALPGTPADYGLTDASARVEVALRDGRGMGFRFGSDAPTETPSTYFQMDGDANVYIVSAAMRDLFDRGLHFLHTVPDIAVADTGTITSVALSSGGRSVTLFKDDAQPWRLAFPQRYPADPAAVQQLLQHIASLRLAVFAQDIRPGTDLKPYGLDQPSAALDIRQAGANTLSLQLGRDINGVGVYCAYDGAVYMAAYTSVGFLQHTAAAQLAFPGVTGIPFEQIQRMEIGQNSTARAYDIAWVERVAPNNDLIYGDDGRVLMDAEITSSGKPVDPQPLTDFYGQLLSLRPAGALPDGTSLSQTPWLVLRVQAQSGMHAMSFVSTGGGQSALVIDGAAMWRFEDAALQRALAVLNAY